MEVVRIGLAKIIGTASHFTVSATTGDCDDVPDLIERHHPHVMIAEPFQKSRDGILWIKDLAAEFPQTKILVASSNAEAIYAERALCAGASGYWMKSGKADELLEAIDTVLSGELYVSPRVALLATAGQTAKFSVTATTSADNGALFSVTVTNSVGSVTSNNATLTVN
jgi:DNA-binding NarL/FixJ family response regulator